MRKMFLSILSFAVMALHPVWAFGPFSGNGDTVTERRNLPAFHSVAMSGSGNLRVENGDNFRVEISLDSNLLTHYRTEVRNGVLELGFESGFGVFNLTRLEVKVTMPELEDVGVSGSANVTIARGFTGHRLALAISGSGSIDADLAFDEVAIGMSGSGSARLAGRADRLDVGISGSGSFEGSHLAALDAKVTVSGSGGATIRVKRSLDAKVSGSGNIDYWGDPSVDAHLSGSGSIRRAGS